MTAALTLLGYALLIAATVPRLLRAAAWVDRAPRLAIIAWQVTTVSILTSVVLAGVALTVPTVPVTGNLAEWLNACLMALREQYASTGGVASGAAGVALALAVDASAGPSPSRRGEWSGSGTATAGPSTSSDSQIIGMVSSS